jgi:hypothetical protein
MQALMQWDFVLLIAIKRRSGCTPGRRNLDFLQLVYPLQSLQAYRQAGENCRS